MTPPTTTPSCTTPMDTVDMGMPCTKLVVPSMGSTITTLAALSLALAIPFSPVGEWLGFRTIPPNLAMALGAIVAVYLVCAELFKPLAIADSPPIAPLKGSP